MTPRSRLSLWLVLLLPLGAGVVACGEPPTAVVGEGFAHHQNHPNSTVAALVAQTPVHYPFRFVVLSDTHHPYGDATFANLREQILQLSPPPVFSIIVGDFVEQGKPEEHAEYMAIADAFPIPMFTVTGNHEQWSPVSRELYITLYGPEDYSFDFAGCRFVVLNNAVPRRNGFTDKQIVWLEQQLASSPSADRFVFMHAPAPVIPPPWGSPPFLNLDRFYTLMARYGVRTVMTGHVHEYRHRAVDGVEYFITGGGGGAQAAHLEDPPRQGIFHNFLLVTIGADGKSKVEVVKEGDHPEPDPDYTTFLTTRLAN